MSELEISGQFTRSHTLPVRSDLHLSRKFWHVGTGLLGLYAYYNLIESTRFFAYATLFIACLGLSIDAIRLRVPRVNRFYLKLGGPFLRDSEVTGYSGLPFYALGVSLSLFLFAKHIALISIMFLVFADPISSLVGILFGQHKIWQNKSLEGAVAGFCTCYIVALSYGLMHAQEMGALLPFALLGGVVGSLSELFSTGIDDNLSIPLLSGIGLSLLNLFFQVF